MRNSTQNHDHTSQGLKTQKSRASKIKKVICLCFYLAKTELINRTRGATFAWPSGRVFVYLSQFEWNHKVTTNQNHINSEKIFKNLCSCCH